MPKRKAADGRVLIKRYGNRRLYNTETGSYVNFQDLTELIRGGRDIQVVDSRTKEDLTKIVLTQIILEEEKNNKNILPIPFLYQLIRHQEEAVQDFFQNYLSTTFEAYLKTKQEFDRRFREWLNLGATAPHMWERFLTPSDSKEKSDDEAARER